MPAATVPVALQPSILNSTSSRFWPLGQHPALQHASFQGTPTSVYIFIYLAVSNWGPGASLKSNVFALQQKVLSLPSEWGHISVTVDEDCLVPPVQSLNHLFKKYAVKILHLCRLNSKNMLGLSPALLRDTGFGFSLRDSLKALRTSLFSRELNRVRIYPKSLILQSVIICIVTSSFQPLPSRI